MSEIWKQQHLPMPCFSTCPSICLSVHTLFLSGYLLGEVRASIVVGQLHVLLTLMNLKMPSDLKKGSTRAARVCEKQPQFVQQILPCHPWRFTSSQAEHRGHGEELFPLWFPILLNMFSKEDTFTLLYFIYTGLKTTLFCISSESLGLPTQDIVCFWRGWRWMSFVTCQDYQVPKVSEAGRFRCERPFWVCFVHRQNKSLWSFMKPFSASAVILKLLLSW